MRIRRMYSEARFYFIVVGFIIFVLGATYIITGAIVSNVSERCF